MNKKEPLPIDNTGTGKLGSIRVVLKKGERMSKQNKCPRCDSVMEEYPALSRRDNETDICSDCGMLEALEDYTKQTYDGKIYWEVK